MKKENEYCGTWYMVELAMAYFPKCCKKAATNQLGKWIRKSDELMENLRQSGWRPHQKQLTPKQVKYIVDHLGEP